TPRTITTAEAVARLETVIDSVAAGEGDVILERDGTPQAVVISFEEYRHLLAVREEERKARKADALKRFQALMAQQAEVNADLTEEEAMELAVRATKETRAELWEEAQQRVRDA
ncbi:unnamed protein product, partial [Phaeothamnion confervicola]